MLSSIMSNSSAWRYLPPWGEKTVSVKALDWWVLRETFPTGKVWTVVLPSKGFFQNSSFIRIVMANTDITSLIMLHLFNLEHSLHRLSAAQWVYSFLSFLCCGKALIWWKWVGVMDAPKQVKVMNRIGLSLFMDDVCAAQFSSHPQGVYVQTLCLSNKHSDLFTKLLRGLFFWCFSCCFFSPPYTRSHLHGKWLFYSVSEICIPPGCPATAH